LAVFILLATIIYLLLFQRNIFRTRLCFYGLLIAAIFFLPQFLFDLRHQFLMTKSILHVFAGGKQGLAVRGEKTGYGTLALQHAQAFFDNFSSSFVQEGYLENIGKIMLAFILAVTVFARGKMKKKERQFVFFIIRLVIIIFVLTFSYPFAIRYWFLTGFQSFFLLLSGLLLAVFSRFRFGKPLVILACLVFLFYSFIRLDRLYVHPPDDGGTQKTKGKLAAIDYIYKDAAGKPFGLLAFTPPVYTDAYDYLVWWRGTNIYHYVPTKDKKETFYLLIEPDSAKPWSYKGWLETVIKVGTVEKTVTLHSGFIVQKRTL
ncbi:MAG TPA: hypothetical protein VLF68_05130, partial [Candidatus Saccharimonadales bacterium]|nr:hypothetical protein [Candidatus Saccharimonadales bacterium]